MLNASSIRATLALAAASLLAGGCDLIDAFTQEGNTLVTVFTNHHASPDGNETPDLGGEGEARVFDNDEGWTVHLAEGAITTTAVTLQRCDGSEASVDFYFGTVAEDLRGADFDRRTLGGTEVGPGSYCGVTVHYGPFSAATDEAPTQMDGTKLDGSTIYLVGVAERGEDRVPFEVAVNGQSAVYINLADRPEGPMKITGEEPFPIEVTIGKTYDRFFDGVDFADFEQADLSANALAVLELETTAIITR